MSNKIFGVALLGFNIVVWLIVGMIVWKNIKVTKLAKNVFKYSIKRKRSIINFGNKDEFKRKYGL